MDPTPVLEDRRTIDRTRRRGLVPLAVGWSLALLVLLAVWLQNSAPVELLMLDAASAPGGRWYHGLVTSLGVIGWTIAMTSCAAIGFVAGLGGRSGARRVFAAGSALIGVLLLDDLFLLHSILPPVVPLPGGFLVIGEMLAIGAWVITGWREIGRTRWELLVACGGALTLSTGLNALGQPLYAGGWTVAEEGAKFLGIVALSLWSTISARDIIRSISRRPIVSVDPSSVEIAEGVR